MAAWTALDVRVAGPVATVVLNRPERRNAVTTEMVVELHQALLGLRDHDELSVVVLTGAGTTFCPGADLTAGADPSAAVLPPVEAYQSATLLHELPQLTVALVNGACAGAGFSWAAACDLRVATAGARFSTSFLQVGLAGEMGLPWTLPRAVGAAVAKDLCFLPRKRTAEELRLVGFLSHVFPDEQFVAQAAELVAELAGRDTTVVRRLKQHFLAAERASLADLVQLEGEAHLKAFTGEAGDSARARLSEQHDQLHRTSITPRQSETRGQP